jgi:hypothetical protein
MYHPPSGLRLCNPSVSQSTIYTVTERTLAWSFWHECVCWYLGSWWVQLTNFWNSWSYGLWTGRPNSENSMFYVLSYDKLSKSQLIQPPSSVWIFILCVWCFALLCFLGDSNAVSQILFLQDSNPVQRYNKQGFSFSIYSLFSLAQWRWWTFCFCNNRYNF